MGDHHKDPEEGLLVQAVAAVAAAAAEVACSLHCLEKAVGDPAAHRPALAWEVQEARYAEVLAARIEVILVHTGQRRAGERREKTNSFEN